jgi:hypothetical protein
MKCHPKKGSGVKKTKKIGLCVCACVFIYTKPDASTNMSVCIYQHPTKQANHVFHPVETFKTAVLLIWSEFRIVPHFMSSVTKTWNYEEILTLLLVVSPVVSLSCTVHTLHHQLVIHDDTRDKSWSVTKTNITMYQLKLNMLPSHSTASVKIYFHR